jgi:Leucine-rich repeat (LRR) protein
MRSFLRVMGCCQSKVEPASTTLDISNQNLKTLPPSARNSNLIHLNMSNNDITNADLRM